MAFSSTLGSVSEYSGSLLSLQTGGILNASVLNFGSGPLSATIINDDDVLDQACDGVATVSINGSPAVPLDYIGKGTAQTLTLLFIPLLTVPAMAFEAGGKIYVHFPDGPPPLSGLLISFSLNPNLGYPLPNPMPICLAAGTLVQTPGGAVAIERLRVGDLVLTLDHGPQPLRWIGLRRIASEAQLAEPKLRPMRIPAGALSHGLPQRDMLVSRQHRMLVRLPDQAEALVPAVLLEGRQGVRQTVTRTPLVLHHLLFDRHEIIFAEGAATESLRPGAETMKSLSVEDARRIGALCPTGADAPLARPVLRRSDLRRLPDAAPLAGVGMPASVQPDITRAVTSISKRMASSISCA